MAGPLGNRPKQLAQRDRAATKVPWLAQILQVLPSNPKGTVICRFLLASLMAMHAAAVPVHELAAVRNELAPRYGSKVVDEGDRKILVVRVPRADPDPVNDVEAAIDYLDPRDVEAITHCILVGDARIDQVYATPIKDLMAERVRFDRQEIAGWRERLPGTLAHELYRSPADPRRRWRLVVRLPVGSVRDMQEAHLEELAERLGTQLEGPRMAELAAVYLIAGADDVRMEADHFIQELLRSWRDEARRRRIVQEREAKELADAARRRDERERLLKDLDSRFAKPRTVARAPLRSATAPTLDPASGQAGRSARVPGQDRLAQRARPDLTSRVLDSAFQDSARVPRGARPVAVSEETIVSGRTAGQRTDAAEWEDGLLDQVQTQTDTVDRLTDQVDGLTRRAEDLRPGEPVIDAVARKLTLQGFDVLVSPVTPFPIDLAAERKKGELKHIVFRIVGRMTVSEAEGLLRMARELDVDHVFCVAEQADDEAKRIVAAGKITWFRPHELRTLRL